MSWVGEAGGPEGGEARSTGGIFRQMGRVFVENKLAVAGLAVIVLMILFCFVGPHLYPTNQTNTQLALQNSTDNAPPGNGNPLGTDESGFDILGRLMFAGQASLIVGFASAFVATVFGTLYGAISGFFGSWFDALLMRVVDVFLSIPVLFLLVALVTIYHQSEILLILVIAFVSWLVPARLIRGETLSLRRREYVQAVRVMGGNRTRIIGRHIIPNFDRDHRGVRHIPDRRLHPSVGRPRFHRPRGAGPADRLGHHAVQRCRRRRQRVLVADLPGRYLHRPGGGGLQLRGRCPARFAGGQAATALTGTECSVGAGLGARQRDRCPHGKVTGGEMPVPEIG